MAPTPMQITLLIALFTSGALSAPARPQFGGEHSSIAMQFSAFPTSEAAGFTPMATHPGKPTETGGWFHGGFPGGMHFPGGQGGKAPEKRQDYANAPGASSAAGVETSSAYMMPTSTLAAYPTGTGSGFGSGASPSPYGSPGNGYTPPTNTGGSGSGPAPSGGYGGAKPTGCTGGAKPTGGWGGYMQAAKNWMGKGGKPDEHCGDHKGPHPEGPGSQGPSKYGPVPQGPGPEQSGSYGKGPQESGSHGHSPQETNTYGQGPQETGHSHSPQETGAYGQGPKETHGAGAGTATAYGSAPTKPSSYNKRQEGFGGHSGNRPSGNHWSGSTNGREGKPEFPQGSPVAESGAKPTGMPNFGGHGGPPSGHGGPGGPGGFGGFHGPPQ